jgi:hypothetical protein
MTAISSPICYQSWFHGTWLITYLPTGYLAHGLSHLRHGQLVACQIYLTPKLIVWVLENHGSEGADVLYVHLLKWFVGVERLSQGAVENLVARHLPVLHVRRPGAGSCRGDRSGTCTLRSPPCCRSARSPSPGERFLPSCRRHASRPPPSPRPRASFPAEPRLRSRPRKSSVPRRPRRRPQRLNLRRIGCLDHRVRPLRPLQPEPAPPASEYRV